MVIIERVLFSTGSSLTQGKESKALQLQLSQLRTQLESERMEVKRLTSIVATLREEAESTKRYSDNLSREVRICYSSA